MSSKRKVAPIRFAKGGKMKSNQLHNGPIMTREFVEKLHKTNPQPQKYRKLDEAAIFPLIMDSTYELSPSSSFDATVLYREFRIKVMLNMTSLVWECCKAKQISSDR
ncbi:hypothetical protein [Acinetobacter colistiniresistens]|uniref:Uncharacterized protein n=1 Tax=Acinetobacter colistiniresistens TaxID=280145 RepID=A0A558FMQ7_9GAMM|nr:hypothetical protein [Acinetobacter colistiniresistens]TVT86786.1 hypothetical protein FPV60_02545 [Acinetobacter colistiniresistens]